MTVRALLAVVVLAACAPLERNLRLIPPITQRLDRDCVLAVGPVVDARPALEREGGEQTSLTLLVPIPWLWFQRSAGYYLQEPHTIGGARLLTDLRAGLEAAIAESGLCRIAQRGEAPTHTLEPRLEHLYGVGYGRSAFMGILLVFFTRDVQTFLPAGQLSLELTLRKGEAARVLHVDTQALCDPALDGSPSDTNTVDQRSAVVARAVAQGYAAVPQALDRALADLGAPSIPVGSSFRIARLSQDYAFLEVAQIDRSSGRVVASEVVERRGPVFSEPGEWVLALEQPHALSRRDYEALVRELAARWEVRFEGNLTAARFFGPR